MRTIIILLFGFFIISTLLKAQDHNFGIELDPAPFIFNGYSVSVKYSPEKMNRISFMASVYSSDFPDGMMLKENKDNGWRKMKFNNSFAFFTDFYFNDNKTGFHFGPSVFYYDKTVTQSSTTESVSFNTVYPNIRAGYIWYPFNGMNLYLNPWVNMGSEINIDTKNKIGDNVFKPNTFNYVMAIHLGYGFNIK
jgi:hypothetical protein